MRRLSGLDAGFLYMETPTMHMHVGGFGIFEPGPDGDVSYERLLELVSERLHLAPVFRQRIAEVPLQLHHPVLVDDPDFDLRYHVRRLALPTPGGAAELAEVVGDVFSRPLDRRKPLWEIYYVEGLEGGRFATITKAHHAVVDGISGVELSMLLLDMEPDPAPPEEPPPPFEPERIPTDLELLGYGVASRLRQPLGAVKIARSLARAAGEAISQVRRPKQPDVIPPPLPFQAPRTSLNASITGRRAVSYATVALDDLKAIKDAAGCTVNDVVLGVCAGVLRRWFDEHEERPDAPLVASVPVSVRGDGEAGTLGNRVTTMNVALDVLSDDPIERLATIRAATKGAKESLNAVGAEALTDIAEFTPPQLTIQAARLLSRTRVADRLRPLFNLTISNVPGPQFSLYSMGARMTTMCPLGPVGEGVALNVTVVSYDGSMTFGFQVCPDVVPDGWSFAAAVPTALEELLQASGARTGNGGRRRSTPSARAKAAATR